MFLTKNIFNNVGEINTLQCSLWLQKIIFFETTLRLVIVEHLIRVDGMLPSTWEDQEFAIGIGAKLIKNISKNIVKTGFNYFCSVSQLICCKKINQVL